MTRLEVLNLLAIDEWLIAEDSNTTWKNVFYFVDSLLGCYNNHIVSGDDIWSGSLEELENVLHGDAIDLMRCIGVI